MCTQSGKPGERLQNRLRGKPLSLEVTTTRNESTMLHYAPPSSGDQEGPFVKLGDLLSSPAGGFGQPDFTNGPPFLPFRVGR